MPTAQPFDQLLHKLQHLPPERVAEVEDFIDFLASRDHDRRLVQAAQAITTPALHALWDNPDDAAYDPL
jgi:ABC-type glycerol-3-phosphate transport system substrate-binding protein